MKLIDKDALVEVLKDWRGDKEDIDTKDVHDVVYYQAMSRAIRIADGAPVLDYAPVRHGEWVDYDEENPSLMDWRYRCDLCGCPQDYAHNFCPNCGAVMDGGTE